MGRGHACAGRGGVSVDGAGGGTADRHAERRAGRGDALTRRSYIRMVEADAVANIDGVPASSDLTGFRIVIQEPVRAEIGALPLLRLVCLPYVAGRYGDHPGR